MNQSKSTSFNFTPEHIDELKASIKAYFLDELNMEISNLQTDLFIDFLNENIGKKYYNVGVMDAIKAMKEKADDLLLLTRD